MSIELGIKKNFAITLFTKVFLNLYNDSLFKLRHVSVLEFGRGIESIKRLASVRP